MNHIIVGELLERHLIGVPKILRMLKELQTKFQTSMKSTWMIVLPLESLLQRKVILTVGPLSNLLKIRLQVMLITAQNTTPIHWTLILTGKFHLTWIQSKSLTGRTIHHLLADKNSFQRVSVHSLVIPFKATYKASPDLVEPVQWLGQKRMLAVKTLEKDLKSVITSLEICCGNEHFLLSWYFFEH